MSGRDDDPVQITLHEHTFQNRKMKTEFDRMKRAETRNPSTFKTTAVLIYH